VGREGGWKAETTPADAVGGLDGGWELIEGKTQCGGPGGVRLKIDQTLSPQRKSWEGIKPEGGEKKSGKWALEAEKTSDGN